MVCASRVGACGKTTAASRKADGGGLWETGMAAGARWGSRAGRQGAVLRAGQHGGYQCWVVAAVHAAQQVVCSIGRGERACAVQGWGMRLFGCKLRGSRRARVH